MKNLRLLNKKIIIKIIVIFFLTIANLYSEEAEDIWNISSEKKIKVLVNENIVNSDPNNIFDLVYIHICHDFNLCFLCSSML